MEGLLLLDKPITWTSHDLVDAVRRKTGLRAVGHAGTLDPMATGLMILLLGRATKRSAELTGLDKSYRGSIRLGMTTDSWDMDGKVLEQKIVLNTDDIYLREVFSGFTGPQSLPPPIFSAVKLEGRRAHAIARSGETVEMAPRPMRIDKFELEVFEAPEVYFGMDCSKGTYVRTIAHTLGERLGCGAALSSLVRTRVGHFRLDEAMEYATFLSTPLEAIEGRLK